MTIRYLTSYQIGRVKPDKELRVSEFKNLAKENKKLVPDAKGIEIRLNGNMTRSGNIINGPDQQQIKEICEFISMGDFEPAYLHLSIFGLNILRGDHRGKKVDEYLTDTFDKYIGHYKEEEALFGQSLREKEWKSFSKGRARMKPAIKKYAKYMLDGAAPANPQDNLLIENGYFARNSITEVVHYAKRYGLHVAGDIGHIGRELLDPIPREGGIAAPESDFHKFLNSDGSFKTSYLEYLSEIIEHIHFHSLRKEYDARINSDRVLDHHVFNRENFDTFAAWEKSILMGITERVLIGAKNATTCTIELAKKFNTAENINTTIDNLIKTYGSRFESN